MQNKFNIHQKASDRIQDFYFFDMQKAIEVHKLDDELKRKIALETLKKSLKKSLKK